MLRLLVVLASAFAITIIVACGGDEENGGEDSTRAISTLTRLTFRTPSYRFSLRGKRSTSARPRMSIPAHKAISSTRTDHYVRLCASTRGGNGSLKRRRALLVRRALMTMPR